MRREDKETKGKNENIIKKYFLKMKRKKRFEIFESSRIEMSVFSSFTVINSITFNNLPTFLTYINSIY